jgi:pectinesterase
MKILYFLSLFCLFNGILKAQTPDLKPSTKGITGKPDTGYTTFKAYKDILKSHPNIPISWVVDKLTPSVSEQRNVIYATIGDRNLHLDAFYPKKKVKKGRPAILIIHGGGWRTGNRTQHIPLAQHLATLGYACFTVEYRLSTEALYPAAVHDLKAAIRWMRANAKKYQIDTNRIATLGFSAGGQLSALLGNTGDNPLFEGNIGALGHSSKVNAIVDIDGILAYIHPESGEGDDSRSTSAATNWFGFSKTENPNVWNEASALTHAGASSPPTLFINSGVDRMHAGRNDYCKKLADFKIYTEVQTFPDSPHSFCLFNPWFEPTVKYVDDFLKKVFG